jgi:hypothetical protein
VLQFIYYNKLIKLSLSVSDDDDDDLLRYTWLLLWTLYIFMGPVTENTCFWGVQYSKYGVRKTQGDEHCPTE